MCKTSLKEIQAYFKHICIFTVGSPLSIIIIPIQLHKNALLVFPSNRFNQLRNSWTTLDFVHFMFVSLGHSTRVSAGMTFWEVRKCFVEVFNVSNNNSGEAKYLKQRHTIIDSSWFAEDFIIIYYIFHQICWYYCTNWC